MYLYAPFTENSGPYYEHFIRKPVILKYYEYIEAVRNISIIDIVFFF